MDYEKNNEALAIVKRMVIDGQISQEVAEKYFPELKESEDEKVRKELKFYFEQLKQQNFIAFTKDGPDINAILAWLEKQDFNYTFEIKKGHWYKCVCDYMLNDSDLMFKNDRLYYCRSDWRLTGEIDERNVKNIGVNGYKSFFRPATNKEIKDWLEKQGEKPQGKSALEAAKEEKVDNQNCVKPVDEVEPKFHEGDWVVHEMSDGRKVIRQIINMTNKSYVLDGEDFNTFYFDDLENNYHLWTIQDAKDGDVLCAKNKSCPFIYDKDRYNNGLAYYYVGIDVSGNLNIKSPHNMLAHFGRLDDIRPATKEQRELLFQKMKEAGYWWDAEKKELKMIKQKPTWSEEDERIINSCIYCFEQDLKELKNDKVGHSEIISDLEEGYKEKIDFLKSLKDRVQPEQEWSEEDEDNFKHLMDEIVCLGNSRNSANRLHYDRLIKFLYELKNRAQPREEWRDKDERMLDRLIAYFEKRVAFTDDDNPRYANWLKSLRPQNHWKPSEEQMKVLDVAIMNSHLTTAEYDGLVKLREQLKKLSEE